MKFKLRTEPQREDIISYLAKIKITKNTNLVVEFKRAVKLRTIKQNSLFYVWMGIIADDTGHSLEEIKQHIKAMFLTPKVIDLGGVERLVLPSTTELSTADMSEFMQQIEAFANSELGIVLPIPEDLELDKYDADE